MGRLGIGDRLNANSKQGIIFTDEYRKVKLDPRTLIPSERNKYAQDDIEELADNMLLVGQLQEVIVGRVEGQDRIIVGHRRTAAAVLNIQRGHDSFKLIDCKVKEMTEAMFMLTLHSANIFNRRLSDWELTEGVAEFKKYLIAAREAGEVEITGKMRDYIADAIGVSTGKMAQMESITNNLCEEGKEAFKNGDINFTTAYETSRLPEDKQKEVIASREMLSGEVKQMVEQERQKKEPTAAAVKKFYEAHAKKYDGDRSKLKELLIEHLGRCHAGGDSGGVDWQCSLRGVKLESAEEITWGRFVQLVNELYPVTESEPEEQVEGQQDLDEYPEVTGGVSIKTDTAHFKVDGALNPNYTTMGLPYSCYITAILHSGAFSQDFIESYKGSRGINALLNIIENYRKKLCYGEGGRYTPGKASYDFKVYGVF
jgi:ParB-like chromosome segregation protein Spo0J